MNVEQVLQFTDALVFTKMGKHLSNLQRILIQAACSGSRLNYDQIAKTSGYSPNYLRQDAAPKLWNLLSDVFGEKIKKSNFQAVIERQTSILSQISSPTTTLSASTGTTALPSFSLSAQTLTGFSNPSAIIEENDEGGIEHCSQICVTHSCQDWGEAPDVSIFYERSNELDQLEQWVVTERCRLVGLVGMGGIGKTYLSVKLAERIQEQFDYVIWRSLRHAPPLQQILTNLLQFITSDQKTDLPATVNERLSLLIDYLRKHRCLLILDNAESILCRGSCAGFYKEGYEDYGDFLKRLAECRHNSCLVITSREKPKEIALMQGKTLPVRCFNLRGLSVSAGQQLLQLKGCHWKSDAECQVLIEQYSGNPLILNIVAAATQDLFEGNLGELTRYKTLVIDEIRILIEQQLNRLSDLENTVLYWLAINREPISIDELQLYIYPSISRQTLIITLKSLIHRSLIEKEMNQFSLQPVLREYASSLLIERVCQEIKTGELVWIKSHALLKTEAKDSIRQTQISLILQPIIDKLLPIFKNKNNLEAQLRKILSNTPKLQAHSLQEFDYAAKNILNIFSQLQSNLSHYNLAQLKVGQSYLQDVNLPNVNFIDTDFATSAFTQHVTNILSVAFSPDGRMLATRDANGEVRLWQVTDSKLLLICKEHAQQWRTNV